VVNFGLSLVSQAVEDWLSGRPSEFLPMVGEAVKAGAKAVLRTTVVTYSQSITLLRRAKGAFSTRLIRAITSSTLVMSAIADVVVISPSTSLTCSAADRRGDSVSQSWCELVRRPRRLAGAGLHCSQRGTPLGG